MIIVGIDASKNGTGVVALDIDIQDNFNIKRMDYLSFTQTKKYETERVLFHHKKKSFNDDLAKYIWMRDNIIEFIKKFCFPHKTVDYMAIEDYAFDSPGRNFDKAEFAGALKLYFYENFGSSIRKYSPKSIKKFGAQNGNADKVLMCKTWLKEEKIFCEQFNFDLGDDPEIYNDVVDAYYIAKLLFTEVKIIFKQWDYLKLTDKQKQVFGLTRKNQTLEDIIIQPYEVFHTNQFI